MKFEMLMILFIVTNKKETNYILFLFNEASKTFDQPTIHSTNSMISSMKRNNIVLMMGSTYPQFYT